MTADIISIAPRDLVQGSPEWRAERCGKVTSSRVSDIVARTKTGWSASRNNYMAELILERLTGVPLDGYVSEPMRRGTAMEPEARAAYEFHTNLEVQKIGFVRHPRIALFGASPDGFIGDDGEVQFKCPNPATHLETLRSQIIPGIYLTQIQSGLSCSSRQWCEWVSYDDRFPEQMRLFKRRVERDDKEIARLEAAVEEFLAEMIGKISDLETLYMGAPSRLLAQLRGSVEEIR